MAGDQTEGPGLHSKIPGPSRDQHAPLTLLGLPPELRNRVYDVCLRDYITDSRKHRSARAHRWRYPAASYDPPPEAVPSKKSNTTAPGLILTCKKIHEEALRPFHVNAGFRFDRLCHLQDWTVRVGKRRWTLLQHLLSSIDHNERHSAVDSCKRMGLSPQIELWFETRPHHDRPRGVDFILWSKDPDKDKAAWRLYSQLRADENLLDRTAAQITAQAGPPTHVFPTWLVPIHAAVLQDAAWSPGVIRTFWADT